MFICLFHVFSYGEKAEERIFGHWHDFLMSFSLDGAESPKLPYLGMLENLLRVQSGIFEMDQF